MAANNIKGLKVEIGGDTTELGKAIEDVNKKSKDLSSELGQINKLLKMDPGNTDLIAQKQKVLAEAVDNTRKKLDTLKEAERQVQAQFERGEVSAEQYRALQREVIATERKLGSYENAARETADGVKKLGDASEETEKDTEGLGETLKNVAKTGLTAVAAGVTALIGSLAASAEATREYRTEMGKLDTAFQTAGHSSEAAYNTYSALQGVLGETDQAVEAANHLAKLASNEEDLATWTDIATGVYATFGASLPIEGLTEAANETAKTGALTGGLTDALNWAGVAEDEFQAKLDACSTEQERQALITETLSGLYSEAAATYRETNAEVIRANEANEAWTASLAGVGESVEPILTDIKLLGASLLSDLMPGITGVTDAFRGMLNGDEGAAGDLGAAISGIFEQLLTKLTELIPQVVTVAISLVGTLASTILEQAPQLLNSGVQMVANIVNGIAQQLPTLVSKGLDMLMNFATSIYDNMPKLIETGFNMLSNLVQGIMDSLPELIAKGPEIISKLANALNDNMPTILKKGAELIFQIIKGIISAIPTLIANIPKIITAIVDVWEAFNWLNLGKKAINFLKDGIKSMVSSVKTAGKSVLDGATNALKNLPSNLLNLGKTAVSNLGSALKNGLSTVKSGATAIFNGIVNYFKTLPSKLLSIGQDIVRGLWNGISNMTGWVIGKIQGFGDSVLSGIKSFFGIASPSKVFRDEVGKMLAVGMAEGVEKNAQTPLDAMAALSSDMLGEAETVNGLTLERRISNTLTGAAQAASSGGIAAKLDKILAAIEKGQVLMLDGDALVGGTVDRYDTVMGQRRLLAARGAV